MQHSGLRALLLSIEKERDYYTILYNYGVSIPSDILMLTEADWKALPVKPLHKQIILQAAREDLECFLRDLNYYRLYFERFKEYGIDFVSDISILDKEDWDTLNVKPFHKKKMSAVARDVFK